MLKPRLTTGSMFILCCFFTLTAQEAVKIDELGLKNMYRIDTMLYRSEQPNSTQFQALMSYGISEIMNLRTYHKDDDVMPNNAKFTLYQVKMKAHKINEKQIISALQIIKKRQSPMLIHCLHGSDRTGIVVAFYRILFQNWTKEQAITEMTNAQFEFHKIYSNIVKYIQNADIEKFRKNIDNE